MPSWWLNDGKAVTAASNGDSNNNRCNNNEEEEGTFTNGHGRNHNNKLFASFQKHSADDDNDDEERDSLLREAADHSALLSRHALRFRGNHHAKQKDNNNNNDHSNSILGFVRSGIGGRFTCHSIAWLSALALALVILPLAWQNWNLKDESSMQEDYQKIKKQPPHTPSLGGGLNPGHYSYNDNVNNNNNNDDNTGELQQLPTTEDTEEFPQSNVGVAVISTTDTNRLNAAGHFWHDPYQSPYASSLYAAAAAAANYNNNSDVLVQQQQQQQRQAAFNATRLAVMRKFGFFDAPDFGDLERPDFTGIPHRDKPVTDFTPNHWQSNEEYLKLWLVQAKDLVSRVKEGIYQEYGYIDTSTAGLQKREKYFGVILRNELTIRNGIAYDSNTGAKLSGVAYMPKAAWQGLTRKLLHAMMTHDDFYAIVVGRAHTYQPNNFMESQIMQFNHIMEPVFDKLGVRLISRNMGMDASTTVSALGGADIYGEADILWYIPDTRSTAESESLGQFDLLHKQAILSGERMPLILSPQHANLLTDTNFKAWVGNIQPGTEICPDTRIKTMGGVFVPPVEACRYLHCDASAEKKGICRKYRSKCWEQRSDWNPGPDDTQQDDDTGSLENGYPNYQEHRWEGRKLAMVVLTALEQALEVWIEQTFEGNVPLPEDIWHVGDVYEELRESVRTLERKPGKAGEVPYCEKFLNKLDPMICHMAMHAYTEWTPRVNPYFNRIKNITDKVSDDRSIYYELYKNVDIRPFSWKVPDNAVDVHMIALATTSAVNEGVSLGDLYPKKNVPLCDEDGYDMYEDDPDDYEGYWDGSEFGGGNGHRQLKGSTARSISASKNEWRIQGAPLGFCDGSAQSRCNRVVGNSCLMANYNHFKSGVFGPIKSGWLDLTLTNFREGVILLRFDWQTGRLDRLPDDFVFQFSIDGVKTSWNKKKFQSSGVKLTDDLVVHPLLIDKEMSQGKETRAKDTVKIALQFGGTRSEDGAGLLLTHIYYA